MNFLLVASFAPSVARFRGRFLEGVAAAGGVIHVAAPAVDESNIGSWEGARKAILHNWSLARTKANPLSDVWSVASLALVLRRAKPQIVLAYTIKPIVYGMPLAALWRVPNRYALVTGLGSTLLSDRGLLTGVTSFLYRLALGSATKVFFQNPDDEAFFRSRRLIRDNVPAVVVNGSGVDLEEFAERPPARGPMRFLMIGRLLIDKGVREYVAAAQRVKALFPGAEFALVGWVDENPTSITSAELDEIRNGGVVEYLGPMDDVRSEICRAGVYVLPSYREGTPRTVLEAMAMGRAIITTDAPGCRETVIESENGFLVPVQSVDKLVEAMLKFLGDPSLARRMGRRSRQIAEDKYDVHKVNAVMLREMGIPVASRAKGGQV